MSTAAVVLLLAAGFVLGALAVAVAVAVWLARVVRAAGLITKGTPSA